MNSRLVRHPITRRLASVFATIALLVCTTSFVRANAAPQAGDKTLECGEVSKTLTGSSLSAGYGTTPQGARSNAIQNLVNSLGAGFKCEECPGGAPCQKTVLWIPTSLAMSTPFYDPITELWCVGVTFVGSWTVGCVVCPDAAPWTDR